MKTFTDTHGRQWSVALNIAAVKRARDLAGVDLLAADLGDPSQNVITRLAGDPVLLCDVIYAVCKPEADANGVSDEDFGAAMAGDAIDHATRALLEELADFFPNRRDRDRARRILAKMDGLMDRAQDLLDAETSDEKLDAEIDAAMATLGETLGGSPGPSGLTPDR